MDITVRAETFPIAGVFAISRGARTEARVLTVEIRAGGRTGRGECVPYARYGETPEGVAAAIELGRGRLEVEQGSDVAAHGVAA